MFARHCAVVHYMKTNRDVDYVLFLDSDMGVINPKHRIEEYIDPNLHLTFYDRLFNYEIASGSYIAKNSDYALDFLTYWANYNFRLPKSLHGTDNGALHQVFMDQFSPYDPCKELWEQTKDYNDLFEWQACTRYMLGKWEQEVFDGKVKVNKKGGHTWARDGWQTSTRWSASSFIFHGWKEKKKSEINRRFLDFWDYPFQNEFFVFSLCSSESALQNWNYKPGLNATDEENFRIINATATRIRREYEKELLFLSHKLNITLEI